MTRSIFDPTGGETEHSGSRNLGPTAQNISHMPPEIVEGHIPDTDDLDVDLDLNEGPKAVTPPPAPP